MSIDKTWLLPFGTWQVSTFMFNIGLAASGLIQYVPKNTDEPRIKGQ